MKTNKKKLSQIAYKVKKHKRLSPKEIDLLVLFHLHQESLLLLANKVYISKLLKKVHITELRYRHVEHVLLYHLFDYLEPKDQHHVD